MERIILPSCGESESLGIENIKMERFESPSDEDCVVRPLDNQPSFSSLGYVKAEVDDFDASPAPSSDMKHSEYHDNDSILKQLLENRGKIWNSDAIENSQSEHTVSNLNIKLEGDEIDGIIEESHSEETKSVIEDTKIFTHQLLAEDMICKTEDSSPTEDCVFCETRTELNENLFVDDNSNVLAHINRCDELQCSSTNISKTQGQIIDLQQKQSHMSDYGTTENYNLEPNVDIGHSKRKNYECHICDFASITKFEVQRHIIRVHLKTKDHECQLCESATSVKEISKFHVDSVIYFSKIKHKCNMCDFASIDKGNLGRHIRLAHQRTRIFKCHMCDFTTSGKYKLEVHIDCVHLKERKYKCHLCAYAALRKEHIQLHIDRVHLKLKNHKCSMCDYATFSRSPLKLHFESMHLKVKNRKCEFCDYTATRKQYLQRHIKVVHLKLRNHKCEFCDYSSTRKQSLQRHINGVHLKEEKR